MTTDQNIEPTNPPAKWREMIDGHWQYHAPGYAVYGTIHPKDDGGHWLWDARVMFDCERPDRERTRGVATSREGAMRVLETVCMETGTCYPISKCRDRELQTYTYLGGVKYRIQQDDSETITMVRC